MDTRIWKLVSDYVGNDTAPYSTDVIVRFCADDNASDPEGHQTDLEVMEFQIVDRNRRGRDGYIVAELWDGEKDGAARLDPNAPTGASIIEDGGDVTLNLGYWDCNCKHRYIHPNSQTHCPICHADKEDQPNSRDNEVFELYNPTDPQDGPNT